MKKIKSFEAFSASLIDESIINENLDQQELEKVEKFLKNSTESYDDFDWDGDTLEVFLDGECIEKYSKADLTEAGVFEGLEADYSELVFKMDKFMPEDEDIQNEYHEILDTESDSKLEDLIIFFENNIQDESRFNTYMPANGTLKGLCEYIINHEK